MSTRSSFLRCAALLAASFTLASIAACGSGSSSGTTNDTSGTTPGSCMSAGARVCERACGCSTDGKCRIATKTDAGVGSLIFKDEKACRDLYIDFGCAGGGSAGFDYGRCESSIRASTCIETTAGKAAEKGIVFTDECKVP